MGVLGESTQAGGPSLFMASNELSSLAAESGSE